MSVHNSTSPWRTDEINVPQITRILAWKVEDVPFGSEAYLDRTKKGDANPLAALAFIRISTFPRSQLFMRGRSTN